MNTMVRILERIKGWVVSDRVTPTAMVFNMNSSIATATYKLIETK